MKLPNAPAPGGTCSDPDPSKDGKEAYVCPIGFGPKSAPDAECVDATSCDSNCCQALPPLQFLGGEGCTSSRKCQKCQGDCDSDRDCVGALKCFRRMGTDPLDEAVPGCGVGEPGDSNDYCYGTPAKADALQDHG